MYIICYIAKLLRMHPLNSICMSTPSKRDFHLCEVGFSFFKFEKKKNLSSVGAPEEF